MVTTAVLLETKEIGVVIAVLVELRAEAVKPWVLPISRDIAAVGEMMRLAGTGLVIGPELPPPQATSPSAKIKKTTTDPTEPDLPMHPPRPIVA
jgi:hypothetical protein